MAAISNDVLQQLSFATSGGPVCPQLRRLTWTSGRRWEHSRQFLSPHLVSVHFYVHDFRGNLGLDSVILPLPTTNLETLRLTGYPPRTVPIRSALSEVVQRLNTCFKRIDVRSSLSDAAWARLAYLPKLESLAVSDTPSIEVLKSIPHELAFPVLEHVTLELNDRYQHLPALFSLLKSSPLQGVTIKESLRIRHVDAPSEVATAIIKTELHQRIGTLVFTGFHSADLTSISHLGPFNSLKKLVGDTQCQDHGECVFPFTDSDIERLASGLPQLVTLRLGHQCEYGHVNITIKSMISLSTHCPSLDSLCLPCDLTNISEDIKLGSGEPDPRLKIRSSCVLRDLAFQWMIGPGNVEALGIMESAMRHLFPLLQFT